MDGEQLVISTRFSLLKAVPFAKSQRQQALNCSQLNHLLEMTQNIAHQPDGTHKLPLHAHIIIRKSPGQQP